jgi:sugar phosphate permease
MLSGGAGAGPAGGARPAETLRPWVVWGLAALFVVYNYLQQVVPAVIAPELGQAFDLGAGALGGVAALFFTAYAVLQIPVGLTVDRYGPHLPLALAAAVAALGSLAFGAARTAGAAGAARLVIGAGAAFSFIACLKLVSSWFPPARFATLAGLTNTAGMIGAASGGAPLTALVRRVGWRGAMGALGGAGLLLAALVLLLVRNRPAGAGAEETHRGAPGPRTALPHDLRAAVLSRQGWVNAAYATAMNVIFAAFGALWGPAYVAKAYGVATGAAAAAVSMLFLGAIAGSLFFGWVSDRLRSRRIPMIGAAACALAAMAALLALPGLPLPALRGLLALLGFFCSANIVSYAVAQDISPPGRSGLALGFLNTCFYAGGAASQPIVGRLLDLRAAARAGGGVAALSTGDYRFALSSVLVFLAVGVVAALALRESHPGAAGRAGADRRDPGA